MRSRGRRAGTIDDVQQEEQERRGGADAGHVRVEQVLVSPCPAGSTATVRLALAGGSAQGSAECTEAAWAVVAATARAVEAAVGAARRLEPSAVDLLLVDGGTVAVVVLTLLGDDGVDRLSGSATVRGASRVAAHHALVRATFVAFETAATGRA